MPRASAASMAARSGCCDTVLARLTQDSGQARVASEASRRTSSARPRVQVQHGWITFAGDGPLTQPLGFLRFQRDKLAIDEFDLMRSGLKPPLRRLEMAI